MELILVRHAMAEDPGPGQTDESRSLTERGKKQARVVGEWLDEMELVPYCVLTSPRLRAVQTSQIIIDALEIKTSAEVVPWLGIGMTPERALDGLHSYDQHSRILLVGHNPDFAEFAEFLLGARAGSIEIRKASVLIFDFSLSRKAGLLTALVPEQKMA